MGLFLGNDIETLYLGNEEVEEVYLGSELIWAIDRGLPVGTTFDFEYTGTVQEVTLPPGRYKLYCWGAQGGTSSGSSNGVGSKGGYSEGILTLDEQKTLYVFVGGKGSSSGNGGWNGGGGVKGTTSYNSGGTYGKSYPACGGGATDICLVSSTMNYSNYINSRSSESLLSRFIVAGGGGGGSYRYTETETTDSTTVTDYVGRLGDYSMGSNNVAMYVATGINIIPGITYYLSGDFPVSGTADGKQRDMVWIYYNNTPDESDHYISDIGGQNYYDTAPSGYSKLAIYWYIGASSDTFSSPDYDTIFPPNENYPNASVEVYHYETTTSTSSSSSYSNQSQQGGGTSGIGQYPGTQSSGGKGNYAGGFGYGGSQQVSNYRYAAGGGGGGWYGGGTAYSDSSASSYMKYTGGGSGFVNIASNSSYRPSGYIGLQLDSGQTIAGNTSHPSTIHPVIGNFTETGHSGNGFARIIRCDDDGNVIGPGSPEITNSISWDIQSGTWNSSSYGSAADGLKWTCVSPGTSGSTVIRCTFSGITSITFNCVYSGESSYDYLTVGNLDSSCTRSSYKTSLKGTSGTAKDITYTCDSGSGQHFVEFCYSKDGSVDTSPDNATVYIKSYS